MRGYQVLIHEEAEADLAEAYGHIAKDSSETAAQWRTGLLQKAKSLRRFPLRCHLAPEAEILGREVRHLIHGNYRVLFVIEGNTVTVLHIRHGARLAIGASSTGEESDDTNPNPKK